MKYLYEFTMLSLVSPIPFFGLVGSVPWNLPPYVSVDMLDAWSCGWGWQYCHMLLGSEMTYSNNAAKTWNFAKVLGHNISYRYMGSIICKPTVTDIEVTSYMLMYINPYLRLLPLLCILGMECEVNIWALPIASVRKFQYTLFYFEDILMFCFLSGFSVAEIYRIVSQKQIRDPPEGDTIRPHNVEQIDVKPTVNADSVRKQCCQWFENQQVLYNWILVTQPSELK